MNFHDIGIIIAKRSLKEQYFIISLFTQKHGVHSSLIKDTSHKFATFLQIGNLVDFTWRGRLSDHLGYSKCELIKSYSALLIFDKIKLYAFNAVISLIKIAFHEKEPHEPFFHILKEYLENLSKQFNCIQYIKLELAILAHAGYSLQLDVCAVTGSASNLCYVSPKSGKAISQKIGLPYANKLLPLPKFLSTGNSNISSLELKQAFDLTSYFLTRYLFRDQREPAPRAHLIQYLLSI